MEPHENGCEKRNEQGREKRNDNDETERDECTQKKGGGGSAFCNVGGNDPRGFARFGCCQITGTSTEKVFSGCHLPWGIRLVVLASGQLEPKAKRVRSDEN